MSSLFVLEWSGAVLGLIGAFLLALNVRASRFGWLFYLGSNLCWLAFGFATQAFGLVVMSVGFTITTFIGIYRWLRAG